MQWEEGDPVGSSWESWDGIVRPTKSSSDAHKLWTFRIPDGVFPLPPPSSLSLFDKTCVCWKKIIWHICALVSCSFLSESVIYVHQRSTLVFWSCASGAVMVHDHSVSPLPVSFGIGNTQRSFLGSFLFFLHPTSPFRVLFDLSSQWNGLDLCILYQKQWWSGCFPSVNYNVWKKKIFRFIWLWVDRSICDQNLILSYINITWIFNMSTAFHLFLLTLGKEHMLKLMEELLFTDIFLTGFIYKSISFNLRKLQIFDHVNQQNKPNNFSWFEFIVLHYFKCNCVLCCLWDISILIDITFP